MTALLCRNRVRDYQKWREVFDSHCVPQEESGLILVNMWRSVEDPNQVFFLFEVTDREKALAFISTPEAAEAGEVSGVLDGEYHFLEDAAGQGAL